MPWLRNWSNVFEGWRIGLPCGFLMPDGESLGIRECCSGKNGPSIAVITISRLKVLNALNAATLGELADVFETVAADDAVRVILLTGEGSKAFVAGADISELATLDAAAGEAYALRGTGLVSPN